MLIAYLRIIEKYLKKNKGNKKLKADVDSLLLTIKNSNWRNPEDIKLSRPDADKVHSDGFYFFNISNSRTMILIEFEEDQASIVWCGNHKDYEVTFKNNKSTIRKWLQNRNWI